MAAFLQLLNKKETPGAEGVPEKNRGQWTGNTEMSSLPAPSAASTGGFAIPVIKNPDHLRSDFDRAIHALLPVQGEDEEGGQAEEARIEYYDEHGRRHWDFLGTYIPQIRYRDRLMDPDNNLETILVAQQCWDQVLRFLKKHHYELLYGCLHCIVFHLRDTPKSLEMYKSLYNLSRLESRSYDMLGQCLVEVSPFPMCTSLLLADFYDHCAETRLAMTDEFIDLKKRYTDASLEFLRDLESDQLATMMIHVPTDFGRKVTTLSVAIEKKNIDFVSDSRVNRIMTAIWSNYNLMNPNIPYSTKEPATFTLLRQNPSNFYRLPVGKYNVQVFCYLLYAVCFSFLTYSRPSLWAEIGPIEWLFWFSNLGFVIQEVTECLSQGWANYLLDWSNYIDMIMVGNFLALMMIRYTADECTLDEIPEDPECWEFQENTKFVFYRMFWAINAVLIWVRCTAFLSMHPTLGPLIKMCVKMMNDLFNFFMVIFFFFAGFMFAFYYYVGHVMDEYADLEESFVTLYRATLGDFELVKYTQDEYPEIGTIRSYVATILCIIYVTIGLIVLLNLLIAMMAQTFNEIAQDSKKEFIYQKSVMTYLFSRQNAVMPPPLNMVVYIIWSMWFLMRVLKVTAAGRKKTGDKEFDEGGFSSTVIQAAQGDPLVWYCQYCHHQNDDQVEDKMQAVEDWFNQFEVRVDSREQAKVKKSGVEICNNCWRPKRRGTWARLMLEKISFWTFLATIFLPLGLILALPGIMEWAAQRLGLSSSGEGETVEELLETYAEIKGSGGNKQVQNVFNDLNQVNQGEIASAIEQVDRTTNNIVNLAKRLIRSKQ